MVPRGYSQIIDAACYDGLEQEDSREGKQEAPSPPPPPPDDSDGDDDDVFLHPSLHDDGQADMTGESSGDDDELRNPSAPRGGSRQRPGGCSAAAQGSAVTGAATDTARSPDAADPTGASAQHLLASAPARALLPPRTGVTTRSRARRQHQTVPEDAQLALEGFRQEQLLPLSAEEVQAMQSTAAEAEWKKGLYIPAHRPDTNSPFNDQGRQQLMAHRDPFQPVKNGSYLLLVADPTDQQFNPLIPLWLCKVMRYSLLSIEICT